MTAELAPTHQLTSTVGTGFGVTVENSSAPASKNDVNETPDVREVLDCLPYFAALLTADGVVQYVNRAPLSMAGVKLVAVVGKPLWLTPWWRDGDDKGRGGKLPSPHARPERLARSLSSAQARVREACALAGKGESTRLEVRMRQCGGRPVLADLSVVPLLGAGGQVRQITVTASPVSTHSRPRRESLDRDRRKDEFLAMLAHELRNPLAPLRNAAALMRLTDGEDAHRSAITSLVDRQVGQMSRLLDDLLDASRIDQGKISLTCEPVELGGLLAETLEGMKLLTDARRQHLVLNAPGRPVWIKADPVRLTQIIDSLVNNAAKFTDSGGTICVTLSTSGQTALLSVSDNGQGIDAELLPRVFDLFSQGARSLDRSQGGLGLGLALVRKLVLLHDGEVTAHSPGSGLGSEFVVILPLMERRRSRPVKPMPASVASVSRRVMVVDDNVDAAQSLAELLALKGHDTRAVTESRTALAMASTFAPDVVLLDIGLPEIDGLEVARRLRTMPPTRSALLVALTGYGRLEDRKASRAAGFDHHLVKPVSLQQLEELIGRQR